LRLGTTKVSPLEVSWAVLGTKLAEGNPEDMTVMRVIAKGRKGMRTYDIFDKFDAERKITSMGKTTGYTASIVTQMLGRGEISGKGVIPPENAVEGVKVRKLISELSRRGVRITSGP
jgi:lysine 6-dehydrogenase